MMGVGQRGRVGAAVGVLMAVMAMSGSTCNRAARQHPLTLEDDVFSFHKAIREKDFRRAATFMGGQWQDGFERGWRPLQKGADIHDLEVLETRRSADADYAHVEAVLKYAVTGTLEQREYTIRTMWKGEGVRWFIDAQVDPPPEFRTLPEDKPVEAPPAAPSTPSGNEGFGG